MYNFKPNLYLFASINFSYHFQKYTWAVSELFLVITQSLMHFNKLKYLHSIHEKNTIILEQKEYVDITLLKTVYYSLMNSHIQFCITTWGVASATDLKPLKKLHKRVIRIITNTPF